MGIPESGSQKSNLVFYSAVVYEFMSNPERDLEVKLAAPIGDDSKTLRDEITDGGKLQVENAFAIQNMPRNSIIGKIINDGAGKKPGKYKIFYPFFPSHMSMPVKAGEQVWVIYESAGSESKIGCRRQNARRG